MPDAGNFFLAAYDPETGFIGQVVSASTPELASEVMPKEFIHTVFVPSMDAGLYWRVNVETLNLEPIHGE